MKTRLDIDKIARGLGAERRGKVAAGGGYFGAMQLLADIEARFRVPSGGGRPTDPGWIERRAVPPAPRAPAGRGGSAAQGPGARGGEHRADAGRRTPPREDDPGSQRRRGRESRPPEAAREPLKPLELQGM